MTRIGIVEAKMDARTTGEIVTKTDSVVNQDRRASSPPVLFSPFRQQAIKLIDAEFKNELLQIVRVV